MLTTFWASEAGAAPSQIIFAACLAMTTCAMLAAYTVQDLRGESGLVTGLSATEDVSLTRN